jgi:hypothetical protein
MNNEVTVMFLLSVISRIENHYSDNDVLGPILSKEERVLLNNLRGGTND